MAGTTTATVEVDRSQVQTEHDTGRKVPVNWEEEEGHDAWSETVAAADAAQKTFGGHADDELQAEAAELGNGDEEHDKTDRKSVV